MIEYKITKLGDRYELQKTINGNPVHVTHHDSRHLAERKRRKLSYASITLKTERGES